MSHRHATPAAGSAPRRARRLLLALSVVMLVAVVIPAASQAAGSSITWNTAPDNPHAFGNVVYNTQSATYTVTMKFNYVFPTAVNATISGISFTGANPGDFVRTGGTCTGAGTFGSVAGGTCTYILAAKPTALAGTRSATFNVASNVGSLSANLTAQAVRANAADISFLSSAAATSPISSYDLGNVAQTQPISQTFSLYNTGTAAVTGLNGAGAATVIGPDAGDFAVTGNTCPSSLAVGATCDVTITATPTTVGPESATLKVAGSATTTLPITLTGATPVLAGELRDTAGTAPRPVQDFGTLAAGLTPSYQYRLVNSGNIPLTGASNVTLTGAGADAFTQVNTCPATLNPGLSCSITVSVSANAFDDQVAQLTVGTTNATIAPSALHVHVTGGTVTNDQLADGTQKRWLDTLTIGDGSDVNRRVRVAFDLRHSADFVPTGLQISSSVAATDTPPDPSTFATVPTSTFDVRTLAGGGARRSFVVAEASPFPAGWTGGTGAGGSIGSLCTGAGTGSTATRRMWVRLKDDEGHYSQMYGSIVRAGRTVYAGVDCNTVPGTIYERDVTAVDGTPVPDGADTQDVPVAPGVPVTFTFKGKGGNSWQTNQPVIHKVMTGIRWRIRNAMTGAMFVANGPGAWTSCAAPCNTPALFTVANGSQQTFTDPVDDTPQTLTTSFPARGRWIVEAVPLTSSGQADAFFNFIGAVDVNSDGATSPALALTGAPGPRPDTDQSFTITAAATDPLDPVSTFDTVGGRAQTIEWDLDGDHANGDGGDGYEIRTVGDPATGLPPAALQRAFTTAGKTPGPYEIRVRVTDNGAFNGFDPGAHSRTAVVDFTINHPPQVDDRTVDLQADEASPQTIPLTATDADDDPITSITVAPGQPGSGTLAGLLPSAATYAWAPDFTGIDTYEVVGHDDHAGSDTGSLTVRVHPNTQLTSSDPDGATQQKSASFAFASPQTAVAGYECRLLRDGEVVEGEDWASCSTTTTGTRSYANLDDGAYEFQARAVSTLGLRDGTPATHAWRVDTTAPTVVWSSGPSGPTNDTTPTYTLGMDDASAPETAHYECRFSAPGDEQWHPCGDPVGPTGSSAIDVVQSGGGIFGIDAPLPEGEYTIAARATDEVGLTGPVATRTIRVDTTPPGTAIASGPEGLINTRDVQFSVTSTEAGSTFLCRLEGEDQGVVQDWGACPGASGSPTYASLADDRYTFSVKAVDPATNVDPQAQTASFEVDATPPGTDLVSGPPPTTQSRHATVAFTGSDNRLLSGFECRLDSASDDDWQACQSPESYGGLADGAHTLQIRAIDDAGNRDPSPLTVDWAVDRTAPATTFDDVPPASDGDANPTVTWHADETSTSECRLDASAWAPCASPLSLTTITGPLADGPHELQVRATDAAGNVEPTPAVHTWTVDTVAPSVAITAQPADPAPAGDASVGFRALDGAAGTPAPELTTQCVLDYDDQADPATWDWEDCTSPYAVPAPADGPHRVAVRAIDAAGNVSAVQAYAWTVDATPTPAPHLDNVAPEAGTTTAVTDATAAFSLPDETGVSYDCRLDGAPWQPCESPYTVSELDDGAHQIDVRARDAVGNISPTTSLAWTVDHHTPSTHIDSGPSGTVRSREAALTFSSDRPASTFECRVDGESAWSACASPLSLTDLADGPHSLTVRAVDATVAPVGLHDPTPATREWTVDATAPDVAISAGPASSTTETTASLAFSSTDPTATFECSLDAADFGSCTSPASFAKLAPGGHLFKVRAVDPAGNASPEAARDWTVVDQPVSGAWLATLSGGALQFSGLPAIPLGDGMLKLSGDLSAGNWHVARGGVHFEPLVQQAEISPGTSATLTITLTATEDATGHLPPTLGDGPADLRMAVQVQVEASLSGIPLITKAQNCTIGPVVLAGAGTYTAATKTVSLHASDVLVPAAGAGCGSLGTTVNGLLHLPGTDNAADFTFTLGKDDGEHKDDDEPPVVHTETTTVTTPGPTTTTTVVTPSPLVPSLGKVSTKVPSNGRIRVPVWCVGSAKQTCSGTVALIAKERSRTVTLGRASYTRIAAGRSRTVTVALTKSARKRLASARSKGLLVSLTVTPAGAKRPTITKRMTVRAAAPSKKRAHR